MRKKLLILVDWFEPGYKAGGPIQSVKNLVRALEDVFDIYVLTSDRDLGDTAPYNSVAVNTWTNYSKHTRVYYASIGLLTKTVIKKIINDIEPSYIYLNSMYSWHFTIQPLIMKRTGAIGCPVLIAPRGMLQSGAMQFKSFKKKFFISLLNLTAVASCIYFHATDEVEKNDVLHHFPATKGVRVIGNLPAMDNIDWLPADKAKNTLQVVFLSRIAPKKNLLFLLNMLKAVSKDYAIQLHIYGESEDAMYLDQCRTIEKELPSNIAVQWHGALPNHKIALAYRYMHIFILPTFGENFGHAIFEAMALGKPVVISDKTPWRNLQGEKMGLDIPLQQPKLFVDAIEKFAAMNQDEYNQWSKGAWQFAAAFRTNNQLKNEYLQLFSEQFLKQ